MDRVFKSKVDWWYHLLIGMIIIASVMVMLHQNIWAIAGVLAIAMGVLHVFFNTYYTITADGKLIARCGFFPLKTIAITDIEGLEPSVFPGFSYALSLNRISVWSKGAIWMLISPQNQKEFIKALKEHNPGIEIRKNSTYL